MKKYLIYFSILVFLIQIAYADTQIFSGKVITDQDKVIEDGIFRFKYDEPANKVYAITPSTSMIIDVGACKNNDLFRICVTNATYYDKNITTYVYYYEVVLTVYKLTGSLSPTSIVDSNTLLPNEPTIFKITINNPTDFDIRKIIYKEDFYPFQISEVTGCSSSNTQILWEGTLKPRYDKICTAKLITDTAGTYILKGNLSYFNGYETKNETTDSVSITVLPKQLKVIRKIDNNTEINQPFYINYSVQNVHQTEKIESSMALEASSNIKIIEFKPYLNRYGNTLTQTLLLDPGKAFNFSLYLEQISAGDALIKEKYPYSIKTAFDTIENYTIISAPEVRPNVEFISEFLEVKPDQKFIVAAKLSNPSKIYELTDIEATLNAPPSDKVIRTLSKLLPNQNYTIISSILTAPQDSFKLDLSIKYTFNGAANYVNSSSEIKVKQEQENISVETTTETPSIETISEQNETQTQINETIEEVTDVIQDIITTKPKIDFSDKRVLVFIGIISILVFVLPISIIIIRRSIKKKKEEAQQKAIQEELENINKPKDF